MPELAPVTMKVLPSREDLRLVLLTFSSLSFDEYTSPAKLFFHMTTAPKVVHTNPPKAMTVWARAGILFILIIDSDQVTNASSYQGIGFCYCPDKKIITKYFS